jgi:acetyl esterase/lipase
MAEPHEAIPFVISPANADFVRRQLFDLPYVPLSPAQRLDIYWPAESNGPYPVIVSIHGGPAYETPGNLQKVFAFLDRALGLS